ncbi:ABC-type transport system, involved in lipoprotein release, permease component (plasmid) [Natrinema pellirubrum DSM 15624]|uniref:ABC-type transport system, involved in lipoprotein release, permease component n=2 Tax=Natrinema pellirubrum (strain DSM 15624 / CIP 106293 / JCM 10476 / NCIMB 786 / 157) TaxID=797303 RepID=L0JQE8_NATP1|nr:ABC transporter permease [Natrinema pellirubrum]AGB33750.1 ABC-type transport system, involved in lipoprotein release, permease component [Natrinema pellirubrum DSM 15624]
MLQWFRNRCRQHVVRLRTAGSLTIAQFRQQKLRLALAIIGVALAVLAVTLLAGTGIGVLETGEQQFSAAERDLWVTAGETRITSAGGGGFENTLYDSRNISAKMQSHEGVSHAIPLAFETVYVSTDGNDEFDTFIATGLPQGGPAVQVTEGEGLEGDPHYANGTYDGEMTRELLIDRETANTLDVSVGDTVNVGGSLAAARENEFTVIGISPTFEQMLGTPTVTMPLSELHQITGNTRTEPATFITITVEDGADTAAVQQDLEAEYPEYEIRSNQEQLSAVLQEQVLLLAAAATLVFLAIGAGIALTVSLLSLVIHQQRQTFAALTAQGVSSSLLIYTVIGQGLIIGVLGGGIGILLTLPGVTTLNKLSEAVVGFDGLVQTAPWIYGGGLGIAVIIGTIAAVIAGWRISRTPPLEILQ